MFVNRHCGCSRFHGAWYQSSLTNEQINLVCKAIRKLLRIFWDKGFEGLYLTHKSGIEKIENVCNSQVQG